MARLMRLPSAVALAWLALAGPARADSYPQIVVDRPLVLLPDMTEADLGVDFPTYRVGLSSHTALGDYHDVVVGLHHAFGPVQLGIQFADAAAGPLISAGPRTMIGPGALDIDLGLRIPTDASGLDHEYRAAVRYTYKAIVVPSAIALYSTTGVELDESGSMYSSGDLIDAYTGGGAELQLAPELTVTASGSLAVPLDGTTSTRTLVNAGGQVTYVVDRFDVFANLWFYDLARTRMPYASVGVGARFGG